MRRIALALLLLLAPAARAADLEVRFLALDTHGESTLVRTPGGKHLLIDGGLPQGGPQVVEALRAAGVRELELVVSTHDDPDHFGGLPLVLDAFPVKLFWETPVRAGGLRRLLRQPLERTLAQRRVRRVEVERGARLEVEPDVTLEALAPARPWLYSPLRDDPNPDSLVLRLTHGATRLLFTGDVTKATEARLLREGVDLSCDLVKVPHHGIDTSSSRAFLDATRARTAVACCSSGNGGPSPAVLERLRAAGLAWWRTDANGTIVVRSTGQAGGLALHAARGRPSDADPSPFPGVAALARSYARWPTPAPPPGDYVGMVGRRAYHELRCVSALLIPRWQRVTFTSEAGAAADGRRPCALCRP